MGNEDAKHWLMLSPFLILFFVFTILPVLSSVVLSFFDFDAVSFPRFAGLENYMRMFTSDDVFSSFIAVCYLHSFSCQFQPVLYARKPA